MSFGIEEIDEAITTLEREIAARQRAVAGLREAREILSGADTNGAGGHEAQGDPVPAAPTAAQTPVGAGSYANGKRKTNHRMSVIGDETRKRILDALRAGPLRLVALSEAVTVSKPSVHSHCRRMVTEGKVCQLDDRRYALAEHKPPPAPVPALDDGLSKVEAAAVRTLREAGPKACVGLKTICDATGIAAPADAFRLLKGLKAKNLAIELPLGDWRAAN